MTMPKKKSGWSSKKTDRKKKNTGRRKRKGRFENVLDNSQEVAII
jgi:hypothetical protein